MLSETSETAEIRPTNLQQLFITACRLLTYWQLLALSRPLGLGTKCVSECELTEEPVNASSRQL